MCRLPPAPRRHLHLPGGDGGQADQEKRSPALSHYGRVLRLSGTMPPWRPGGEPSSLCSPLIAPPSARPRTLAAWSRAHRVTLDLDDGHGPSAEDPMPHLPLHPTHPLTDLRRRGGEGRGSTEEAEHFLAPSHRSTNTMAEERQGQGREGASRGPRRRHGGAQNPSSRRDGEEDRGTGKLRCGSCSASDSRRAHMSAR